MNNNKAPSLQFYPKDALDIKVLRMSDAAQGIYWRLLWNIWAHTETQYKIENNDKKIAKFLGISETKWKKYKKEIQQENDPLLIEENGFLVSKRMKQEREKQLLRRQQMQRASNIRWQKESMQTHMHPQCIGNAYALHKHMHTVCSSSSSSSSNRTGDNTDIYINTRLGNNTRHTHTTFEEEKKIGEVNGGKIGGSEVSKNLKKITEEWKPTTDLWNIEWDPETMQEILGITTNEYEIDDALAIADGKGKGLRYVLGILRKRKERENG
jgi:uncharacterized protein YdaU (DUF1376 family)